VTSPTLAHRILFSCRRVADKVTASGGYFLSLYVELVCVLCRMMLTFREEIPSSPLSPPPGLDCGAPSSEIWRSPFAGFSFLSSKHGSEVHLSWRKYVPLCFFRVLLSERTPVLDRANITLASLLLPFFGAYSAVRTAPPRVPPSKNKLRFFLCQDPLRIL